MRDFHVTSVARITDLASGRFTVAPVPRTDWATGDYVVGEITGGSAPWEIELPSGRRAEVIGGDRIVGAFGARAATLQIVGDWHAIGDDGRMEALSIAGVIGLSTSVSPFARKPIPLRYLGHVHQGGRPARMRDHVPPPPPPHGFAIPTVLIVGTSMDAGKTLSARRIVRELKARGLRVTAAKLTGVARYRDALSMGDAGADSVFDFVDAGMPSTVLPRDEFVHGMRVLLGLIEASGPDAVVAEAGASPLEPYNGDAAVDMLGDAVRCTVLAASDPYAVTGVMSAFGKEPDLVAGRAASTSAGIALVQRLSGVPALNLLDPDADAELDRLLSKTMGL